MTTCVRSSISIECILTIMTSVSLTIKAGNMKITEFANSIDLYEAAYNEPPHIELDCLPYSL